MSGNFRFAVDLGTSNTVAVVDRGDGTPRPLLFDGNPLLPSAVFADPSGQIFVGRDAERHMMTDAARYEPNPKGHIDDGMILLGDRELPVAELFAAILRRVAAEATQTGVNVGGATVLTCPVDWGNTRRGVLLDAAVRAGLGRVTLLDEPVAAATYCVRALGSRLAPGRCVVVFDFGGGTLDVTVVQSTPPGLKVLATGGLDDLGGTDIDAALVGHLGQLVGAADEQLWRRLAEPRTTAEFRDRRMFWSEVRAAKEMLARSSSAPIHVPGHEQATHLTREELDRIAGPLVDRAVDETRRVLQRSGVPVEHLDAIVLVGGSSRLPLVASRLHARFGLAPVVPEQPELPVAFGALLLADNLQPAGAAPSTGDVRSGTAGSPTGNLYGSGNPAATASAAFPSSPPASGYASPSPVGGYPSSEQVSGAYPATAPVSAYPPTAPVSGYPSSAPVSGYPSAPVSGYPAPSPVSGYPAAAGRGGHPSTGQAYPAAPAAPAVPGQRQPRPSVIIGPGVTLQGNVAVYGDADLMPDYLRDEPEPRPRDDPRDDPRDEPARTERRGARRRPGGILRGLRFLALPLIPWVLIMALTPWGRGLFNDGRAKVQGLFGAGASPSVSAPGSGAPAKSPSTGATRSAVGATVQLNPPSGKAGVSVQLTVRGFQAAETIEVRNGIKVLTTLTADKDGAATTSLVLAPAGTKTGAVQIQLRGRTSTRSATAQYVVKSA